MRTSLLLIWLAIMAKEVVLANRLGSELLDSAARNIEKVKDLASKMGNDLYTRASVSAIGTSLQQKKTAVGVKFAKAKQDWQSATAEEKGAKAGAIAGAITGVGEGMVGFVNGIKNGDWKGGLQGALKIISSVVALAGPVGVLVSSVLSLVSSIFSMFGGTTKTESMDDKIERIVSEQINIGREKDLQAEVEGMKMAYRSISSSVHDFREMEQKLGEDQANELYNRAFDELEVFGKLEGRVREICDADDFDKSSKCLATLNMYAEISVIRQLLLADMAALMADVHERDEERENGDKGGLLAISNNLLHLIKKEQETDVQFLGFLADPFNNPKRRYVIDIYFSNPENFTTLKSYLRTLHDVAPGGIYKDYAIACDNARLGGSCVHLEKKTYNNLNNDPGEWNDKTVSIFLPIGFELSAWSEENKAGNMYGPFAGPIAHSRVPGQGTWKSMEIKETERDAEKEVRFCARETLFPGDCDTAPIGNWVLNNYHGFNWEQKIKSMYIPPGLAVDGYIDVEQRTRPMELFIGPQTLNWLFNGTTWKSMNIRTAEEELDARNQVKFCDKEDFGGQCRTTWKSLYFLPGSYNMYWAGKIKSLKIPGGFRVTGYLNIEHRGAMVGPYTGPAVISKVDSGDKWMSMKLTEFNEFLEDDQDYSGIPGMKHARKKKISV